MSVWIDPLTEKIEIPDDLQTRRFRLGDASFQLLPKQYEFLNATEEFIGYIGGYGSGKTKIGLIKAAALSVTTPGNRGIVGRRDGSNLEETSQRDLIEFLHEAKLLKEEPNARNKRALVHCIDLKTGRNLGGDAEISFQHLDDPDHLRGRHVGWVWIDEGSEVKKRAWQNLIGRLRLPAFQGNYQAFVTGNPEGRNWIYDFFFNEELIKKMTCGGEFGHHLPQCKDRDDVKCNRRIRKQRRAIHCTSYENYFLPPEYLENMINSFSVEDRQRYVEASFDVFEGQIYKEFRHDIHVIEPPRNWIDGRPPREWPRILAIDVGGASPWAWEWSAIDPDNNVITYDEIYETTANTEILVDKALPKMVDEEGKPYTYKAKVIDYENKIAAEDLRRRGITMTNARKHDKTSSINRLKSYIHPNQKHHFPNWHPRAGQSGSPRYFVTTKCRNLVKELPQQRWKEDLTNERMKDEADRTIANHATDCELYKIRELPDVATLRPAPGSANTPQSLISALYWEDVRKHQERQSQAQPERRYRIQKIPVENLG